MDTRVVRRTETAAASAPAGMLTLEIRPDGRLWAVQGGGEDAGPVWVRRSFPWSEPSRFLSLRDDDDQEVALVQEPAELDAASRHALEQAMREAGFVLEVTRVLEIEEEIEIRHWREVIPPGALALSSALLDRLSSTPARRHSLADGLGGVAPLPHPVGRLLDSR